MEETTIPRIDAPAEIDRDNDELQQLVGAAMSEIRGHLSENRSDYQQMTSEVADKTLDEVLTDDNTRSVDVRAKPFENPKVTLWLKDCPIWANDSWRTHVYPNGINSYNGKVTVTFDVRPF